MLQHSVHFILPHFALAFRPWLGQHEWPSCASLAASGSTTFGKYGDSDISLDNGDYLQEILGMCTQDVTYGAQVVQSYTTQNTPGSL